jgi:hypothetical protein
MAGRRTTRTAQNRLDWEQADEVPDVLLLKSRPAQGRHAASTYPDIAIPTRLRSTTGSKRRALFCWCTIALAVTAIALVTVTVRAQRDEVARVSAELAHVLSTEAAGMTDPQRAYRSVAVDAAAPASWQDECRRRHAATADLSGPTVHAPEVTDVHLCEDQVIVGLHFRDLNMAETRVYRATTRGWVRTVPSSDCWGQAEITESTYFRLMYQGRDRVAVDPALPQLDRLYLQQRALVGLPAPDAAHPKPLLVIDVARLTAELLPDAAASAGEVLTVPSPLLLAAPDTLTPADVFVRAADLPLAELVMDEAACQSGTCDRRPYVLLRGITLWLQWHALDDGWTPNRALLESIWQVQLQTTGAPALHDLGQLPGGIGEYWLRERYVATRPDGCALGDNDCWADVEFLISSGAILAPDMSIVAAVSLVDYLVHVFGTDVITDLLAACRQADDLDAVLEMATGTSLAEIEAGWHASLQAHFQPTSTGAEAAPRLVMLLASPKDCSPSQTTLQ